MFQRTTFRRYAYLWTWKPTHFCCIELHSYEASICKKNLNVQLILDIFGFFYWDNFNFVSPKYIHNYTLLDCFIFQSKDIRKEAKFLDEFVNCLIRKKIAIQRKIKELPSRSFFKFFFWKKWIYTLKIGRQNR